MAQAGRFEPWQLRIGRSGGQCSSKQGPVMREEAEPPTS
jgi:hypothetical protein